MSAPKDVKEPQSAPAPAVLDAGMRRLIGYTLKRVAAATTADAARALEAHELRVTTFSALSVICDNPDVTQSALAQSLAMERSNIVVIIDTLEEAGLIGRHRMKGDRRAYALRATLKGIRRRDAAMKALQENEERQLADLSPEERQVLAELLDRIQTRE
jgi:DNA-binding MarR family transcriptional regulator